jgi:beta-lactamase regulating signal transducer with metallopeptidase domain
MIVWAVESLIAVTALMLLVLALRGPVARLCGAEWAYALWLLPLLRLLMPAIPGAEILHILPPEAAFIPAAGGAVASPPSSGGPGQWVPLLALWAGGATVFIFWQVAGYRRFVQALLGGARPSPVGSFGGFPVVESEGAEGPLAVGLIERLIVVPPLFEYRYSAAEQELALQHELIHHRRRDIAWNSLALFVLALMWFNPVAYFAFRAFRADQELACDAAVLRRRPSSRSDYANALVKSASKPGELAACPLNSADQLKRRLKMMKTHRSSTGRTFGGAALLGLLLTGGLGFSAPGFAQEEVKDPKASREIMIKRFGKDGKPVVMSREELADLRAKCGFDERSESNVTSGDGKEQHRTRVVICGDGKNADSPERREQLAKALERARGDIGDRSGLSEKARAQSLEALDREIARLRSPAGK